MNIAPMGQPYNVVMGPCKIVANYGLSTQYNWGQSKGGIKFSDNYETKDRESDSDYGRVKGAIDMLTMKPTLTATGVRRDAQAISLHAGMSAQTISDGKQKFYRTNTISYDLTNIAFLGRARSGEEMAIVLKDPINLMPYAFETARVEEVASEITWEATYDPDTFDPTDDTTYPYYIEIEISTVTLTIDDGTDPIEGAVITLSDGQQGTSAVTTGIIPAMTLSKGKVGYSLVKSGFTTLTGTLTIDEDTESETLSMTAV